MPTFFGKKNWHEKYIKTNKVIKGVPFFTLPMYLLFITYVYVLLLGSAHFKPNIAG